MARWRRRRRPELDDDVPAGARKAVVLWGADGSGSDRAPVPSAQQPWELQEWDGSRWVSCGQATSQQQADAFFAETAGSPDEPR
jgi:hypothetical protein